MKNFRQRLVRQILVSGVVFFCWSGITSAQGWDKVFDGPSADAAYEVVSSSDGHIITFIQTLGGLGFSGNSLGSVLVKMDTLGNTIWLKELPIFYSNYNMGETNDGGVILGNRGVFGNQDITILRVNSDGEIDWTSTYSLATNVDSLNLSEISQTSDNGFIFSGGAPINGEYFQFLGKIDSNGNLLWSQNLNATGIGSYSTEISQQNILIAGQSTFQNGHLVLTKTDASGNLLWSQEYPLETGATQVTERPNGNIIVTTREKIIRLDNLGNIISSAVINWSMPISGNAYIDHAEPIEDGFITSAFSTLITPFDIGFVMAKFNDDGNLIWSYLYNYHSGEDISVDVAATADGGFVSVGQIQSSTIKDAYILKSDENGILYGNEFSGTVKWDENENCDIDAMETPLKNWIITATNSTRSFSTLTDENGEYFLPVNTGIFELKITPPINYWSACQNNLSFDYSTILNKDTIDFAIQSLIDCPYLEVNSNVLVLRPCFDNSPYIVNWCNQGTIEATNASLEIILDSEITPISSTLPWSTQNGDTLIFDLGNITPGECGNFTMDLMLDCNATLGATYCVETHIYPDSLCLPTSSAWDGAFVEVTGECQDSTVSFQIENSGMGNMTQDGNYIIVEDAVMLVWNNFNLSSGQASPLSLAANGSTYVLMATQEPGAPGNPSPIASLEECGTNGIGSFSVGFINQFPLGDDDPFVDIDCREATAAYDPNDKQGFPIGYDDEHFIEPNTDIEYLIRFQNTGTDTAFNVVLRDTLDESLDLSTIRQGVGTHDYNLEIVGGNILEFTFVNIMLPDSNINEAASHGAVEFKISQRPDLSLGTVIRNKAAIYFDFNPPIITNETFHTLGVDFITVSLQNPTAEENRILVRPNPMQDFAIFELKKEIRNGLFELYDVTGKLAWQQKFSGKQFELKRNENLRAGIYFYKISEDGRAINSGKIIVN